MMKKILFSSAAFIFILLFICNGLRSAEVSKTDDRVYSWICLMQKPNGLVEEAENSNFVSLYSNALAAVVFTHKKDFDRAKNIFLWFRNNRKEFDSAPGGFGQFRDAAGFTSAPHRWMGDNCWLLIALRFYKEKSGDAQFQDMAADIEKWLRALQDKDGGVWGGYKGNWELIEKNTEGNIDALNAVSGYDDFHRKLFSFLKSYRWDKASGVFITDWEPYKYAPDLISWGYLALGGKYKSFLDFAGRFEISQRSTLGPEVTGICFDLADKDCIWIEATGQMALAYRAAGMNGKAGFLIREIEKMYAPSAVKPSCGGMVYASQRGTTFGPEKLWEGADTKPALGTSCWYLMAKWNIDPMAGGRARLIKGLKKDGLY
jgi:cellulose synthase operon protein B